MPATIVIDAADTGRFVQGSKQRRVGTINLGVYATNGVAVTRSSFDLPVALEELSIKPVGGRFFEWDKTNGKVKAFQDASVAANAALAEVPNAVDLTTVVARFDATGR